MEAWAFAACIASCATAGCGNFGRASSYGAGLLAAFIPALFGPSVAVRPLATEELCLV